MIQVTPKWDAAKPKHIVTGLAVLRYPTLVNPEKVLDSPKASWGATLVFLPAGTTMQLVDGSDLEFDGATVPALEKALMAAFSEKWSGADALAKLKAGFSSPTPAYKWGVRRDADQKGFGPAGTIYVNARRYEAQGMPTLVDAALQPVSKEQTPKTFYEGAIVRASLDAYAYDVGVSKGVTFSLVNLQKIADGPVVKYGPAPADDFDALMDAAQPADLSDLGVK